MEHTIHLKRYLARCISAGLAAGVVLGLVEVLILLVIDRMIGLSAVDLLGIVLAWGAIGLVLGLVWGLWHARDRRSSLAGPAHDAPTLHGKRVSHVAWTLTQGMGAGLVSGIVVSLVEIAGLVIVGGSWGTLSGLLYAAVAYGLLGLLGGLIMGLLWGLWAAWRKRDVLFGHPAWPTFVTVIVSVGVFLVVHNRVRRSVLGIPQNYLSLAESLLVDNALLLPIVALGVGLWLLLRRLAQHRRLVQLRWNAGTYLVFLLVAILTSNTPGMFATPAPATTEHSIPAHLRDRPNVILIVADTLRADRLGPRDGNDSLTPHVDALARDGMLYSHAIAQASWTRPSVGTMFTSLYPTSHRATTVDARLPDQVVTLPEILSDAGYHTTGMITNWNVTASCNFQQGFDEYIHLPARIPFFGSPISSRFAVFAALLRVRGAFYPPEARLPNEVYRDAEALNEQALPWLEANKDARFFLYLHYMDPHDPYYVHPYDGTSSSGILGKKAQVDLARQLYDGEVSYLDGHLGVLFDTLKRLDLYQDTLIIFTSDHGEEFYEHEGWTHGLTLYEEQLAVPLIVKYPGTAYANTVDEEYARILDIAPTVLDAVGIPIPEFMQGTSLHPRTRATRAEVILAETDFRDEGIRAIRVRQHKLIIAPEGNTRNLPLVALFDLAADPGEQQNLAASEPDRVRQLRVILDQVIAYAQANAVTGRSGEVDAATRERLKQLGY